MITTAVNDNVNDIAGGSSIPVITSSSDDDDDVRTGAAICEMFVHGIRFKTLGSCEALMQMPNQQL